MNGIYNNPRITRKKNVFQQELFRIIRSSTISSFTHAFQYQTLVQYFRR